VETLKNSKGRAPRLPTGDRLTRSELAKVEKTAGRTVAKYLDPSLYPDAPKPDAERRYSRTEYRAHVAKHSPRASGEAMLLLKEDILRIEKEERAMKLAVKKGLYITKAEASQTISPLMAELGEMLRSRFVLALPGLAVGRSAADIQTMCEGYLAEVIKKFREGTQGLTT
jgi:hypothetical protein